MSTPALRTVQWAGAIAVLGACVGMVGDYFLLYHPQGGYMEGDYAFLRDIPNSRLIWGHYLGVLAIPLEAAGLYLAWLGLLPMGRKVAWAGVAAGFYAMFMGVAYHGTVFPLADAVRMGGNHLEDWRAFSEPLATAFVTLFFVLVLVLTVAILRKKTAFPRSYALVSPIVTYALVAATMAFPPVGNFLAPMGFNLCMGVFFGWLALRANAWLPAARVPASA